MNVSIWKRLLLMLVLFVLAGAAALADGTSKRLPYNQLPANLRAKYAAELVLAEQNARSRAPGTNQLFQQLRGRGVGYSGSKSANGLKIDYAVSACVVKVGEKVRFDANLTCSNPPMIYLLGGLVFDEGFNKTGDLVSSSDGVLLPDGQTFYELHTSYTPSQAGYFNFVLAVVDDNGNAVAITTNTVLVYEDNQPPFSNVAVDEDFAVLMNLDRSKLNVGTTITATAEFTTQNDPVMYRGVWTLTDENGSVLDVKEISGEVLASSQQAKVAYAYQPLQAGKVQFVLTASDGAGNQIKNNTPYLAVGEGFHFAAQLDAATLQAGGSATATYQIHGHDCGQVRNTIGWRCYDAEGKLLNSQAESVTTRSGKSTFSPRIGQDVEFYAGASCVHFPDEYPATAYLTLLGAIDAEVTMNASSVVGGSAVSANYYVDGGLTPYQSITVTGHTYDQAQKQAYTFLTERVTALEGTVTGTPQTGDEVWFEIKVVESDGHTMTWQSSKAVLTTSERKPGDADANGTVNAQDALLIMQQQAGWSAAVNTSNADVDGDGRVTMSDALRILRFCAGENVSLQ